MSLPSRRRPRFVLAWFSFTLAASSAFAQPTAFTYQGQLKYAGSPANGNYNLSFTLWDDPAAGNLVAGPIDLLSVPVANGLFTSELDFGAVFGGAPLWLEISVNATPLVPRQSITSAPYCQTAGYAQSSNVANYSYAPWVPSGADLYFNSGRVGLGLTNPTYTLDVNSPDGIRLGLQANGGGALVLANNAGDNKIYLEAYSADQTTHADELLLTGWHGGPVPKITLNALETTANNKLTAYGNAQASFLWNGVIVGNQTSGNSGGAGVLGFAATASGHGVVGWSNGGAGVLGFSSTGDAVLAVGNFRATGTKSFVIDHPLDPANKFLQHYCTEAPEPMNAYSGVVTTDARGYATVKLPAYFQSINRDFRYQLTVIDDGDDFVQAKITREISDNAFALRTSKPGVKVSWEVKAVRNDAWCRAHAAPIEFAKRPAERGKYFNPEFFGQPASAALNAAPSHGE